MKINVIQSQYKGGKVYVTFMYWYGSCACEGETVTRVFDKDPTQEDLRNSV